MQYNKSDNGKAGIYVIINTVNGKRYIGKSINILQRIYQHIGLLNTKSLDENRFLINSWHKHGSDNFKYEVLEYFENPTKELILNRELYWILYYNTVDSNFGYNLRLDERYNMVTHEETRKLMSISQKQSYIDNPNRKLEIGINSSNFWKDNPDIKDEMALNVSKALTKYTIVQLTRNLEIIKEYESQIDIRKNYPDLYLPAILQVCNGNKASYKDFYWRYRSIETGLIIEQPLRRTKTIPVVMINKTTNTIIQEFESSDSAGKFIGHTIGSNVNTMCRNKTFWVNKDFYFRYKHEVEDIVQS